MSMEPTRIGNRRADGCVMFVGLEDQNGNLVNFLVSPTTFVLDYVMLREGMEVTMYYRTDEPVPLIYPPQYRAAVAVPRMSGQMVDVDYYNRSLINQDMTLQLNLDGSVDITTTNNQRFWVARQAMTWWWYTAVPPGAFRLRPLRPGSWCYALKAFKLRLTIFKDSIVPEAAFLQHLLGSVEMGGNLGGIMGIGTDGDDLASFCR